MSNNPQHVGQPQNFKPASVRKLSESERRLLAPTRFDAEFEPAREAGYAAIAAIASFSLADVIFWLVAVSTDRKPIDQYFDMAAFGLVEGGLALIALLAIIGWQCQVHENLPALGNRNLKWAPSWSKWCWLIGPIGGGLVVLAYAFSAGATQASGWSPQWTVAVVVAGLPSYILPFLVMMQIWRCSDPNEFLADSDGPSSRELVVTWWGCRLAVGLGTLILVLTKSNIALAFPCIIASVIAAILAIVMILKINAMQNERIVILRQLLGDAGRSKFDAVASLEP